MPDCPEDGIGPQCPLPLFPNPHEKWTCPNCGLTWVAYTHWRIA